MTTQTGAAPAARRSIVEVMAEHKVPENLEGLVKYMADEFERMEKSLGTEAAEAKATAAKAAAEVLNRAPEGRMERTVTGEDATAREKALVSEYLRVSKFSHIEAPRHKQLRPREEIEREIVEVAKAGGFAKAVAKIREDDPTFQVKTLTTTADTALIATIFQRDVIASRLLISQIRQYANVVPMGGPIVKYPRITTEPDAVIHVQDTDDASSLGDVDTDQVTLTASEIIRKVKVSNETLRDEHVNVMEMLSFSLARKVLKFADTQYAVGTGSSQPEGFTTGTYTKTVAVNGTLSWKHLVKGLNTLGDEYVMDPAASGLCILGNQAGKNIAMVVRDSQERPIFQMTETPRGPRFSVWGLPFVVIPGVTGTGVAGDGTTLYIAALRDAFMIGDRQNAEMFVSTERYAELRSTLVGLTMGHDSRITLTDAVCTLTGVEE